MRDIFAMMRKEAEYDESVLRSIRHAKEQRNSGFCQPTTRTYDILLRGYMEAAKTFNEAGGEAEILLDEMDYLHNLRGWDCTPDSACYHKVLQACAYRKAPDAADLAQRLLGKMKEEYARQKLLASQDQNDSNKTTTSWTGKNRGVRCVVPDTDAYKLTIMAVAQSKAHNAPEMAMELLMEMLDAPATRLDEWAFLSVIQAWGNLVKAGIDDIERRRYAAEQAEELAWTLYNVAHSNASTYTETEVGNNNGNGVVDGRKNRRARDHNSNLGHQRMRNNAAGMPDVYDDGYRDDMASYQNDDDNGSYHDYGGKSESGNPIGNKNGMIQRPIDADRPITLAFNSVIGMWTKSGFPDCMDRAESLLHRMLSSDRIRLDAITFNSILHGLARTAETNPNAPSRAEDLFDFMTKLANAGEGTMPNMVTYIRLLDVWAKSNDPDKLSQARRVLDMYIDAYKDPNSIVEATIEPFIVLLKTAATVPAKNIQRLDVIYDQLTYGGQERNEEAQMNGLRAHKEPETTEMMMDEQKDSQPMENSADDPDDEPNNSEAPTETDECSDLSDDTGSNRSFWSVINKDPESVPPPMEPLDAALCVYEEVRQDVHKIRVRVQSTLFAGMLDVIDAHTNPRSTHRRDLVKRVFADACNAGEVNGVVFKALIQVCRAPELLKSVLRDESLHRIQSVDELPEYWTRRIPQGRYHREVNYEGRNDMYLLAMQRNGTKRKERKEEETYSNQI